MGSAGVGTKVGSKGRERGMLEVLAVIDFWSGEICESLERPSD